MTKVRLFLSVFISFLAQNIAFLGRKNAFLLGFFLKLLLLKTLILGRK